jgi:hypothetical protein
MKYDELNATLTVRWDIVATSISADYLNAIELDAGRITTWVIDADRINIWFLETINMDTLIDDLSWSPPEFGIVMDNDWITWYSNYLKTFQLKTDWGDAIFEWTITASNVVWTLAVPGWSNVFFNSGWSESIEILTQVWDRPKIRLSDDWWVRDLYYDYDAVWWGTSRMAINTNLIIKWDLIWGATDKVWIGMQHFSWAAAWFLYSDAANDLYWLPQWWVAVKLN